MAYIDTRMKCYCCGLQLFTFADRFRGLYDESITLAHQFYSSSGYSVSNMPLF